MKITVAGVGYVELSLAVLLAQPLMGRCVEQHKGQERSSGTGIETESSMESEC